jgi:hypothetical protein
MPDQPLHLAKPSLAYAKLVATPTGIAWSQAYNAGSLFACLSLTIPEPDESISLQSIGKDVFNYLESEFFTLEEKNLHTIKTALEKSLENVPEGIIPSLCLGYITDSILYLFLVGTGKIIMKRGDQLGVLLEKTDHNRAIHTASGYLRNNDTVLLQTAQFAANMTDKDISDALLELSLPNDIAEVLSPKLHATEDGGQAAIILVYHGYSKHAFEQPEEQAEESLADAINEQREERVEQEDQEDLLEEPEKKRLPFKLPRFPRLPEFHKPAFLAKTTLPSLHMSHRKKLFLSIACILVGLLIIAIVFTKMKQDHSQTHALFQQTYNTAQNKYNEGKAMAAVRPDMAQTDFQSAQQTIKNTIDKFPANSPEHATLQNLLDQVQSQLTPSAANNAAPLKEASVSDTDLLAVEKANTGLAFAQDDTNIYQLTDKAVTAISKSSQNKKDIIKNDNDWQDGRAVVPYSGNVYILDRKNGVLKYTAGGDGYGKTSYFKTAPDLSQANAMAIDSSVYLLFQDGTILKYTRGQADTFKVSGLDKPLSHPTKIFTDLNTSSVYVLDNDNRRVVKLGKDGSYQAQYPGAQISDAKDFEVQESNKKILILEGGKIWELAM